MAFRGTNQGKPAIGMKAIGPYSPAKSGIKRPMPGKSTASLSKLR